jgi:F0F1-type ATP synthase assembly protein I
VPTPANPEPKPERRKPSGAAGVLLQLSAVGVQLVVYILLLAYVGHRLDAATGTAKPWWTLGFSLLGAVSGIVWLVHRLSKLK